MQSQPRSSNTATFAAPEISITSQSAPPWWEAAIGELLAGQMCAASLICEPAYRRDPDDDACRSFADRLLAAVEEDCAAFKAAATDEAFERLRRTRLEIAAALLALEPDFFPRSWNLFARAHAALLSTGIRDFIRTATEDEVLERLKTQLVSESMQPVAPGLLLAAMLLGRNFELPIVRSIEQLPQGLRQIYFHELLANPTVFNRIGEAERYVDHLEDVTEYVHERWVRTPGAGDNPVIAELAALYATHVMLLQAYFSSRNLRSLYQKRGEIISAFMVSRGVKTLATFPPEASPGERKIKLGIFMHQFSPHTETYFTLSHFEHLDRARFDVTLYAVASNDDPLERYCVSRADRLVVLPPSQLVDQIARIREDRLDILLISANMTAVTNVAMFLGSTRLARIQVASVSSPVTSGAGHVDVMLSADWNEPEPDARLHYTEHLERLPGSINYYAYQHDRDPATIEVSREGLGISPGVLVFFSGANFFKILPELSASWAAILEAVPGSVLLLMPFNPHWSRSYQRLPFIKRIKEQLNARGVSGQRLRIIDVVPSRADVLRVIALADVYLDAFPFAGACSMLDSILAQIPAIVHRGRVGRSNHGAALMRMVGLEEQICNSEAGYVAKSIALAADGAERRRIHERLHELAQAPVPVYFDTPLFGLRVGAAFESLYRRYHSRYSRLAADGAALRRSLERSARRIIGGNLELNALTDLGIVNLLVEPYFRDQQIDRPRCMVDVGACHGAMAEPLLARGWMAELLEPDPAAREVLERNLAGHAARIRVHAIAAGRQSADAVEFHQSAIQGLSGLSESPFGATANVLRVPSITLKDFLAQREITDVDFLKIDAEGYDFDVLESLDFHRVKPELVLIEYGAHFARQTPAAVNAAIADMTARGYGALVFGYADDGNFKRSRWVYRLTELWVDPSSVAQDEASFGNILFYPAGNSRLLVTLQVLLDCCDSPGEVWTDPPSARVGALQP
jgi:FkbM family methyltransferase